MRDCLHVWFKMGVGHGPERMNGRDVCREGLLLKLPLGFWEPGLCLAPLVLPVLCASWHPFPVSAHQRRAEPPGQ